MEYKGYTIRKTRQSGRRATWEVFGPENRTPWQGEVSRHPDSGVVQAIANAIVFSTRAGAKAWIDKGLPPTLGPSFAHGPACAGHADRQQVVFAHTRQEARQALLRDHLQQVLTALADVMPARPCDHCHQIPLFTPLTAIVGEDEAWLFCSWGCLSEYARLAQESEDRLAEAVERSVQGG